MLQKLKGFRTFIALLALAVLPIIDLMGTINVKDILEPLFGSDTASRWAEIYVLVVIFAAKVLRFVTTTPIFNAAASGDSQRGSAGLVVLLWVVLAGLAGNSYKAAEAGRPVESAHDVKVAVVKSVETRKADWSHLNQ